MAKIVVTKATDIVTTTFGTAAKRYQKCAVNVTTGFCVSRLKSDMGVETNVICGILRQFKHGNVDTVGGVTIDNNTKLFDELVKML